MALSPSGRGSSRLLKPQSGSGCGAERRECLTAGRIGEPDPAPPYGSKRTLAVGCLLSTSGKSGAETGWDRHNPAIKNRLGEVARECDRLADLVDVAASNILADEGRTV